MKRFQKIQQGSCVAAFTLAVFAVLSLMPSGAEAWTSNSRHYNSYHNHSGNWSNDQRRMHSESIAAQEEARREAGRAKRRDELEAERKVGQKEYLASQQAIRDASRGASNAPRDYFYRKPGTTTTSLPASSVPMEVGGRTYSYFSGIFYLALDAKTHVVVAAPVGAVVESLPEGSQVAMLNGQPSDASYYFGTFFVEKDGKFEVVAPPEGTVVSYVPDGYKESEVDDTVRYDFGGTSFSPVIYGQTVVYQVAGTS